MTEHERDAWAVTDTRQARPVMTRPQQMPEEATPFKIGTDRLPVSLDFLAANVCDQVRALSDAWKDDNERLVVSGPGMDEINQDAKSCCRLLGLGRCQGDLQGWQSECRKRHQWQQTKLVYYEAPNFHLDFEPSILLPLFRFRPEGDGDPLVVLRASRLKSPVIGLYLKCDVVGDGPVVPGCIIKPQLVRG
eukprot:8781745-Pyramimonas_sp.AAC.1